MIRNDLGAKRQPNTKFILPITYEPPLYTNSMVIQNLSLAGQRVFYELYPESNGRYISPNQPEIIALRILDFLSSKQGYIRRKGHTFRTTTFYRQILPALVKPIKRSQPLTLSTLCLCTTLANTRLSGESPYPHMASYIAFENFHKIAEAVRKIYSPGVRLVLGFEGSLFRPLYFHSETVVNNALAIFRELNDVAYRQVTDAKIPNPIEVVDALWMIERTFESHHTFLEQVEKQKQYVDTSLLQDWQEWYRKTASTLYFPSKTSQNEFIAEKAKWRAAVHHLKYTGGLRQSGFMRFDEDVIPFTPSGRHTNMLALQLVPENSYLPHHRIITYDPATDRWRMMAYCDIKESDDIYAPRYVREYLYPFYFEKQTS